MRALLSWVAIVVVAVLPVTADENAESPISIVAISYQDTIPRGFTGDVETIVENVTDHQTVWVTFHGQITYADGTVEVITDMEPEQAVEIGPGQALSLLVTFVVPSDTELGPAVFTAAARVIKITGKKDQKGLVVQDSAAFEVTRKAQK